MRRLRGTDTKRLRDAGLIILRLGIAAVFLAASLDKIIYPDRFADVVWEYGLLPMEYINLFAICFPWAELALAICLIAGVWLPAAAMTAAGFAVMFLGALLINIARGNEYLHCGCFTTAQEGTGHSLRGLAWRDGVLLIFIVWLLWCSFWREKAKRGAS